MASQTKGVESHCEQEVKSKLGSEIMLKILPESTGTMNLVQLLALCGPDYRFLPLCAMFSAHVSKYGGKFLNENS